MSKIKDENAAARASKPAPKKGRVRAHPFLSTLLSKGLYKPMQGWNARLATGVVLGILLLAGVWRLFVALEGMDLAGPLAGREIFVRYGLCGLLAAALAWLSFRLVHYPPFADFLIATEAEMNKVSWISRDDLKRATAVVLVTVLLLSLFLFGIDQVWMRLLASDWIGVLELGGGSAG